MNMNFDEQHNPIAIVDFQYPQQDEQQLTTINDDNIHKLMDFITYYVLADKNPRLTLSALCYSAGYDVGELYKCDNTVRSISDKLGVSRSSFNNKLNEISEHINLQPRINNANRFTIYISQSIQLVS
jgi:hypothetical protein